MGISHVLQSGDQVEVLTSKNQKVDKSWREYATTAKAKGKIEAILRRLEREKQKEGEDILTDFMQKNEKEPTSVNIAKLCRYHALASREELLSAIRRELREETGFTADEWTELGDFHPAPAYSDEYITMYMARGLHKGEQDLDEDEFLDLYTVPLRELLDDVMAGRISDAKTQVCVLKAARLLGL